MARSHSYHKLILKMCKHQHLSVEQIFAELKKYFPTKVGRSTVYRNIQELLASGELREAVVISGKSYYETNIGMHAHFIDQDSGRIYDLELPDLQLQKLFPNFAIEKVSLNLYGSAIIEK